MKRFLTISILILLFNSHAQIMHRINFNNVTTNTANIENIDSIFFNASSNEYGIIYINGDIITGGYSTIDYFDFIGDEETSCDIITTEVVEVTNPTTGDTWMDRNIGASQAATSAHDEDAFGDLYQWGRGDDGHQCRYSAITGQQSFSDEPSNDLFIAVTTSSPLDWRSPQNDDLWQGVNGINNPCPSGFRVPTEAEWEAERLTWPNMGNLTGAFDSPLKLTAAGHRSFLNGTLFAGMGAYWSSTVSNTDAVRLSVGQMSGVGPTSRAYGYSVRCIKD